MTESAQALDVHATPAPVRSGWLWYAILVLSVVLPSAFAWFVFGESRMAADEADLYVQDVRILDPADAAGATDASVLPYRCPPLQGGTSCRADFQITHPHRAADREAGQASDGPLTSLYIPSYLGRVTVSLNGVFLATSAWDQSEANNWSPAPILIPLPAPLLRSGDNDFRIILTSQGAKGGFLGRVAIGPDSRLRPDRDRRSFLFVTLPRLIDGWQVAMGLGMLIMWAARPRERIFLLVGVILLFQMLASLPALLGDTLDTRILYAANHGRFVSGSLVLPLAWLLVGRRPPVPVRLFLLLPAAVLASLLMLPTETHQWLLARIFAPAVLVFLLGAAAVVSRVAFRQRSSEAMLLFGGFLFALVFGVHDWLVFRGTFSGDGVMLGHFGAPFLMTILSAVFMWRFAATMNTLDQFNLRLKREVTAAEEELRRSFDRERAQARAATLEAERVRLMSDLHDGIAGQLVSILSLCELRDASPERIATDRMADTVRAALADLRLIVASLDDYGEDLGVMLALFRERVEPQVTSHGMALVWRVAPTLELKGLHPGAALAIYRIFQEATTNALRHSKAGTLWFEAERSPRAGCGVRLRLRDDGRGGAAVRPGSYGMGNMRRRAEGLDASLAIDSGAAGTAVVLDLPARLS